MMEHQLGKSDLSNPEVKLWTSVLLKLNQELKWVKHCLVVFWGVCADGEQFPYIAVSGGQCGYVFAFGEPIGGATVP